MRKSKNIHAPLTYLPWQPSLRQYFVVPVLNYVYNNNNLFASQQNSTKLGLFSIYSRN